MARILHLDDEPSVGMIVASTLSRAGHSPIGVHTIPEALQVLAREMVDLIISDYRMPGLTGLEFLELLRGDSGSLIVEDCSPYPRAVGLLFAGNDTVTLANPIGNVLSLLKLQMVGADVSSCSSNVSMSQQDVRTKARLLPSQASERAVEMTARVKDRHEDSILHIEGVVGLFTARIAAELVQLKFAFAVAGFQLGISGPNVFEDRRVFAAAVFEIQKPIEGRVVFKHFGYGSNRQAGVGILPCRLVFHCG